MRSCVKNGNKNALTSPISQRIPPNKVERERKREEILFHSALFSLFHHVSREKLNINTESEQQRKKFENTTNVTVTIWSCANTITCCSHSFRSLFSVDLHTQFAIRFFFSSHSFFLLFHFSVKQRQLNFSFLFDRHG